MVILTNGPPGRIPLTFSSLLLQFHGVWGLPFDLLARPLVFCKKNKKPSHHSMLFICVRVNVSAEQPWHDVPLIYSLVYLPLAWSLSSWLAVFFHSSIRSCSGVTMPSIRALGDEGHKMETTGDSGECERQRLAFQRPVHCHVLRGSSTPRTQAVGVQ